MRESDVSSKEEEKKKCRKEAVCSSVYAVTGIK